MKGLSGNTTFTVIVTSEFLLIVKGPLVERAIGAVTVTTDESACKTNPHPTSDVILFVVAIKQNIDQQLQGRLRGEGATVVPSNGTLSIAIPLNLEGKGTMDISVTLHIGVDPEGKLQVTDGGVEVKVSLSGLLPSQCDGAAADGSEQEGCFNGGQRNLAFRELTDKAQVIAAEAAGRVG